MLSLLIWNGKGRSYFAKYLCSLFISTLLKQFFASPEQLKKMDFRNFPCGRRHYSASQHHTMRHDDRERYTLQCLTAPHRTTWGQREVPITVSHSTTSYDLTTKRGTHYSVSHIRTQHRTTEGKKKKAPYNVSPNKDKQEQQAGACKSSMLCSFFQLLHLKICFRKVSYACVRFHVQCVILVQ